MKKIRMTSNDKDKGRLAGMVYEVTDKEAKKYIENEQAVEVKDDDRQNDS